MSVIRHGLVVARPLVCLGVRGNVSLLETAFALTERGTGVRSHCCQEPVFTAALEPKYKESGL